MSYVEVPAVKLMAYRGRTYVKGELVTMRPIDALAYSRRGEVSVDVEELKRARAARSVIQSAPEPDPAPVRRRRRYTRRDLSAE